MKTDFHDNFQRMDELSQQAEPFFFAVSFRMDEVEVYTLEELKNSGLKFDFQNNTESVCKDESVSFEWKTFPQTPEDYKKGFDVVLKNLKLGNSYLTNYTCKTKIETSLSLEEIFNRTAAKYKILYPEKWVCFSPETFVEIKENQIFTHPMKGTIDASIPDAAELLKNDKKEKAEHYTVVDLLRNDLSQVADNVQLDVFQRMDYIKTRSKHLFAMSSEISGILKTEFQGKIGSIMKTLLPAGSILGAPKPKTLEIILEAENYDRGFYTGIAGWFDGKNMDSCVLIRFIEKENDEFFFKSGGGITHLSRLEDEYEEMKNKIYVPIY